MQIKAFLTFIAFGIGLYFFDHTLYGIKANQLIQLFLTGKHFSLCSITGRRKIDLCILDVFIYIHNANFFVLLSGASHILAHNNLIQNITNLPRIGKIRFLALDIGNIQNPAHSSFANGVLPRAKHQFRNALQFIPGIVGEIQHKLNSGFKAGIYLDHFLHFIFISSQNDAELSSIILHCLYQCIYGLFAVVRKTLFAIVAKSVGFVDEQHAAHGTGNNPAGFFGCCAKILAHQTAAIHFHHFFSR